MADYKRFVSYMYEYTNGNKRKNVGYTRVETRNGECRFTIYMQMEGLAEGIFPTYLIHRPNGEAELIYIGDCVVKNQILSSRLTVDENDVMGLGHNFSEMGGLLLFLNSNVFYATQWDDKPIILDEVLEALKPKPKKSLTEDTSEKRTLDTATKEYNSKSETTEKIAAEIKSDTRDNSFPDKLAGIPEKSFSGWQRAINSKSVTDKRTETQSGAFAEKKADTQDSDINAANGLPKEATAKTVTDSQANTGVSKAIDINETIGTVKEIYKDQAAGKADRQTEIETGTVSDKSTDETFDIKLKAATDMTVAKANIITEKKADTGEKISSGLQTAAGKSATDEKPSTSGTETEKRKSDSQVPVYMLPRGYKAKEGFKPVRFEPINPWDQVDRYKRFESRQKEKAPEQLQDNKTGPAANEVQIENRNIENIFSKYPRIYPFEDNEIKRCVKIEPKDIGALPSGTWNLSNNSFLLHGYYCYHHLIFAEITDRYGCRYIIGVPGIYHNRERFMARMFGFENFKSIRKRDLRQGDFGYWYQEVVV